MSYREQVDQINKMISRLCDIRDAISEELEELSIEKTKLMEKQLDELVNKNGKKN